MLRGDLIIPNAERLLKPVGRTASASPLRW
jgi:hypothetical protein